MKCLAITILLLISQAYAAPSPSTKAIGVKLDDEVVSTILSPYSGMNNREITLYLQLPMLERILLGTIELNGYDGHLRLSDVEHYFSTWMAQNMQEGEYTYTLHIPLQTRGITHRQVKHVPVADSQLYDYGLITVGIVTGIMLRTLFL